MVLGGPRQQTDKRSPSGYSRVKSWSQSEGGCPGGETPTPPVPTFNKHYYLCMQNAALAAEKKRNINLMWGPQQGLEPSTLVYLHACMFTCRGKSS